MGGLNDDETSHSRRASFFFLTFQAQISDTLPHLIAV